MTSAAAPTTGTLRLVRAPRTVPMYEDEIARGSNPRLVPGPWGVEVPLPFGTAEQDETLSWLAARGRRSRPRATPTQGSPLVSDAGAGPTILSRPEQHRVASSFLTAIIEVAVGRRPRHQLIGRMHPRTLRCVDRLEQSAAACSRSGERISLGRVSASQPASTALEMVGVLRQGKRARALAGRLDLEGQRWVCTSLDLVGDR